MTIAFTQLIDFHQRVYRNIQGIPSEFDEFDDLSTDLEAQAYAHQLSIQSVQRFTLNELQFNAIDFVFNQTSWFPSRFGNGKFPVWYSSTDRDTTFYETLYHWQRTYLESPEGFLQEARDKPIRTMRTLFTVSCDAALIDLRTQATLNHELIDPEPAIYPRTQEIGWRVHREGYPGLITKSARIKTGENIVAFTNKILSAPEHYQNYIYEYDLSKHKITVKEYHSMKVVFGHSS